MDLSDGDRRLLARARVRALQERPYYAAVLLVLRPIAAPGLGTVSVDASANLYVDFDTFGTWSDDERAGALVHEASHVLRNHLGRARRTGTAIDRLRWNLACDAEINDDIDLALPEGAITPEALGCEPGALAEHYYAQLPSHASDPRRVVDCGSCTDGHRRDWESGWGEGLDADDLDAVRRQVAHAIAGAPPGTTSAGDRRWAEATLRSTIDWRSVLRNVLVRSGRGLGTTHWTYRRPSRRRSPGPGLLLPATYTPAHRVALMVDTSASMRSNDLDAVATEASAICRSTPGVGVRLLSCDTAVTDEGEVRPGGRLAVTGGGGTDLRAGLSMAAALRPAPTAIVVATDGLTRWPDAPLRGVNVIALLVRDGSPTPPSWIRTIYVKGSGPFADSR